jgi:hypothetical protein
MNLNDLAQVEPTHSGAYIHLIEKQVTSRHNCHFQGYGTNM